MNILLNFYEKIALYLKEKEITDLVLEGLAILVAAKSIYKIIKFYFYENSILKKIHTENKKTKENIKELDLSTDKSIELISTLNLIIKEKEGLLYKNYLQGLELRKQIQSYGIEPICKISRPLINQISSISNQSVTFFSPPKIHKSQPIEKILRGLTMSNIVAQEIIAESQNNNTEVEGYIRQQEQFEMDSIEPNINQPNNSKNVYRG